MHVHLIGAPGDLGGACTETWHTLRLWRGLGIDVTCIPTWRIADPWPERLAQIGVRLVRRHWADFAGSIPAGSIAVSFCNSVFVQLAMAGRLAGLQCVYLPCMCQWSDRERKAVESGRWAVGSGQRFVFQSRFQFDRLTPALREAGLDVGQQCRVIRGYIDPGEIPFQPKPRAEGESLVIGRLSRADPRKFHAETWSIYDRIRRSLPTPHSPLPTPHPLRARLLGWSSRIQHKLGPPPDWAEVLAPGQETAAEFYRSLHLLVHVGGEADENWPRYCLEAMAAGVPIVTDRRGGICEMLSDPVIARLCDTPGDFVRAVVELAQDDDRRLALARTARWAVEEFYGNPRRIGPEWLKLFGELAA